MTLIDPRDGDNRSEQTAPSDETGFSPSALESALSAPVLPPRRQTIDELFENHAPAKISFRLTSVPDGANIVLAALYPNASHDRLRTAVERVLRGVQDETPLNCAIAGATAHPRGDLAIREIRTLTAGDNRLIDSRATEFELTRGSGAGCIIRASRPPETHGAIDLVVDWTHDLRFQSGYALEIRKHFAETFIDTLVKLDFEADFGAATAESPFRYQFPCGLTIEVTPEEPQFREPLDDAHLAIRPDLIGLCLPRHDIDGLDMVPVEDRLNLLGQRIIKLIPDVATRPYSPDMMLSRSDLENCGDVPFLLTSDKSLEAIVVEDFILIATPHSTGNTLLDDLQMLERLSNRFVSVDTAPAASEVVSLEAANLSDRVAVELLAALNLPAKDYLIDGLRHFVESDSTDGISDVRDSLIFAVRDKQPATAAFTRTFEVAGTDLDEFSDEPADGSTEAEEEAESEERYLEPPAWENNSGNDRVAVKREALITPRAADTAESRVVVRFFQPPGNGDADIYPSKFTTCESAFGLSMTDSSRGSPALPAGLVDSLLRRLQFNPVDLFIEGCHDEPTTTLRTAYLSDSVRLIFHL